MLSEQRRSAIDHQTRTVDPSCAAGPKMVQSELMHSAVQASLAMVRDCYNAALDPEGLEVAPPFTRYQDITPSTPAVPAFEVRWVPLGVVDPCGDLRGED